MWPNTRVLASTLIIATTCSWALVLREASLSDSCSRLTLSPIVSEVSYQGSSLSAGTNNGTDDSTEWDDSSNRDATTAVIETRALSDSDWLHTVERGLSLWSQLQHTLANPPTQDQEVCDLPSRWKVKVKKANLDSLSQSAVEAFPSGTFAEDGPTEEVFYEVTAESQRQRTDFWYNNAYSPEYGVVVAYSIQGVSISQGIQYRASDRWSDLTWALWAEACNERDKAPSSLNWVLSHNVDNPQTLEIVDRVLTPSWGVGTRARLGLKSVTPDDEAFFALLNTPNVIGTLYMMMHHTNEAQHKTIAEIRVYRQSDCHIAIRLSDRST